MKNKMQERIFLLSEFITYWSYLLENPAPWCDCKRIEENIKIFEDIIQTLKKRSAFSKKTTELKHKLNFCLQMSGYEDIAAEVLRIIDEVMGD